MDIEVENKYIITDDSFINVHCRAIHDTEFSTILPTEDPDNPNRKDFNGTDKVILYVEETRGPEQMRRRKRFGYINVSMGINTETEWKNGNTLVGGVLVIGNYNPAPDKCEADVHITMVGPTNDTNTNETNFTPATVNVQVGGD